MLEPFLKWAGGKRWLVQAHADLIPTDFKRYLEPFLGSGAVFFHLQPKDSVLSDTNAELINAYRALKDDWQRVYRMLRVHHREHSKAYYYKIRQSSPRNDYAKAARFIYLNRTCWNGLYRVNLQGQFNVPKGTKTSVILDTDDFEAISSCLRNAELKVERFEASIARATAGDLLFVDPPYTAKHKTNGFIKYNETLFNWRDQVGLHDALEAAQKRGAKIVLTNTSHESVRQLYETSFEILTVERSSVIAAPASKPVNYSRGPSRGSRFLAISEIVRGGTIYAPSLNSRVRYSSLFRLLA
jgi:DNA adenine methylase